MSIFKFIIFMYILEVFRYKLDNFMHEIRFRCWKLKKLRQKAFSTNQRFLITASTPIPAASTIVHTAMPAYSWGDILDIKSHGANLLMLKSMLPKSWKNSLRRQKKALFGFHLFVIPINLWRQNTNLQGSDWKNC